MRLIAYVRVSTEEESPENQEFAIYKWASLSGHQVIDVIRDIGVSGALPPRERPGFQQLLTRLSDADGVVVYALDRIARSLNELIDVVRELEGRGKVVVSVREEWLQNLDPRIRSLIIAILGWAAEMEREFIRQRTKEALMRLKAQGKRLGRPPKVSDAVVREAIKYVERGLTLKEAAKLLGIGYSTLANAITKPPYRAMYYEARARATKQALRGP